MKSSVGTFLAGVIGIGMATAVLLPGRQTIGVLGATTKLTTGTLGTAITGKA